MARGSIINKIAAVRVCDHPDGGIWGVGGGNDDLPLYVIIDIAWTEVLKYSETTLGRCDGHDQIQP